MKSLVQNPYFSAWVSNTVADCMGNFNQYPCWSQRKCALTSTGSAVDACQYDFELYFHADNSETMRGFAIVTTNNQWLH